MLSYANIFVDDVWVHYVALGGSTDAVGVAAYLHGHLILETLQRDLVSHAVNELISEAGTSTGAAAAETFPGNPTVTDWAQDVPFAQVMTGSGLGLPEESRSEPEPQQDGVRIEGSDDGQKNRQGQGRHPNLDGVRRTAGPPPAAMPRAPYIDEPVVDSAHFPPAGGSALPGAFALRDVVWPTLQTRLTTMFDPREAENRRLASLKSTHLFGSAPEERFDFLTRKARDMFQMSSATISFIGAASQSVKSAAGPLGADMPRETSFCSHTISEDNTLVVTDATQDERFAGNALVTGASHIRFYAGHPLTGPGGWRIGALCVLDTAPRVFTDRNRRDLRMLAGLVQLEILQP